RPGPRASRRSGNLSGGGVSERPKERASKAREGSRPPWVQIPPPPLSFLSVAGSGRSTGAVVAGALPSAGAEVTVEQQLHVVGVPDDQLVHLVPVVEEQI